MADESAQPITDEPTVEPTPEVTRDAKPLGEVLAKFSLFDRRNRSTIKVEDFNKLSTELRLMGDNISPNQHFGSGQVTFKEVCVIAGTELPELPISINVIAEAFRKTEGAPEAVSYEALLKRLSYFAVLDANLEDTQVTLEQAVQKLAGPKKEYKLNVFKDAIRRFSKEGDGNLRNDELALAARYLELDLQTDLDVISMHDLLGLVDSKHKAFELGVNMNEVRKAFDWCDGDHSGTLDSNELAKALRLAGQNPSQAEFKRLKAKFDQDNNGTFDFHEFTNVVCESFVPKATMRQKALEAFGVFDTDNSGSISISELRRIMTTYGEDMSDEEVEELFKTFDANSDGKLDINEFVDMLLN